MGQIRSQYVTQTALRMMHSLQISENTSVTTVPLSGKLELSRNPMFMSHGQTGSHDHCCKVFWETKYLAEDLTAVGCMEFWESEYFYLRTVLLLASRDSGKVTNVSWAHGSL